MGRTAVARLTLVIGLALMAAAPAGRAAAEDIRPLDQRASLAILAAVFPGADRFAAVEGDLPFLRAFAGDALAGYVFSTYDVVRAPSYSSIPFDAVVGMDVDGRLTGIRLLTHHDAYLTGFPDRMAKLVAFFGRYGGYHVGAREPAPVEPDFVKGATTSARAMRAGILDAGRVILNTTSDRPPVTEPTLDITGYSRMSWGELAAMNAVVNLRVTYGRVRDGFADLAVTPVEMAVQVGPREAPQAEATDCVPRPACQTGPGAVPDEAVYADLYVALGTPARIGRNLLGSGVYDSILTPQPPGTQILVMASDGKYNHRGRNYLSAESGNRIDRFRLVQGDIEIVFTQSQHQLVPQISRSGLGRAFLNASVFRIPPDSGFDPLRPFDIVLLVHAATTTGDAATLSFPVTYTVPDAVVLMPFVEPPPFWVEAWEAATPRLIVLVVALAGLTLLFLLQDRLAASRRAHRWIRNAFLVFTLVWLGWIAGGQLSIVHVVNYLRAAFDGVDLAFFLGEPLILVLSIYVLLSLILIGRGVFCGWLCPFGALQELSARLARLLHLPAWNPDEGLQRWLWLPKYGLTALIVATAFVAPAALASVEEIEPFKTAITSTFTRPWPYVAYAVALLGMGLFTERFFCRFLCPLGGLLALGDRLHLVTTLRRRPECGSACHLCERSCPVKAIRRSGRIVTAECFQCLDCQVEYHDPHRCPPLARQRKLRVRSAFRPPAVTPVAAARP